MPVLSTLLPFMDDISCILSDFGGFNCGKSVSDMQFGCYISFMATRPHPFSRCDITVLLPQSDGTYVRANYNQNGLGYPASTIKLTYLVSAIEWCKRSGQSHDCMDAHVRPMIYTSDNFETGVTVDYITGSTNYHPKTMNASAPAFQEWWQKRNFTTAYFSSRGLLEDQVLISKTYPTNSGSMPSGAEALLREVLGQNQMKPKCAASLMAEIAGGLIHPGPATDYMLGILQHARYSYTSIGMGTPPGSVMHNKVGNAYDTLEEIAYIKLPDGYSFIMAVYTNGYEPSEPEIDNLSYLAELVIDGLGLTKNLPPKHILTASNAVTQGSGWTDVSTRADKFGSHYLENSGVNGASAVWTTTLSTGIYEVSVWSPENSAFGSVAYTLNHAYGTDTMTNSQRVNGGRWIKLGDFNFLSGTPVTLSVASTHGGPFYANAVKFTQWPSCNGIPGTGCNM